MSYESDIARILRLHQLRAGPTVNNGLSNVVVKAFDAKDRPYAVKFYPRDTFKRVREERFMRAALGRYPVPELFASGEDYLITRFIEGVPGSMLFSESGDLSAQIGAQVGAALARLHQVAQAAPLGFLTAEGVSGHEYDVATPGADSTSRLLSLLLEEHREKLAGYGIPVELPYLGDALHDEHPAVLLHHDVCPKNFLFHGEELVAALDFEYAMIGSPLFDIAKAHVLARYLAYHTGGRARFLDANVYIKAFDTAYGACYTAQQLRPFYMYVLFNYLLFWLSNPLTEKTERDKIVPLHIDNLKRLHEGEDLVVPAYSS